MAVSLRSSIAKRRSHLNAALESSKGGELIMKGNISIGDFIHQVKNELIEAQNQSGEPFYELHEVDLEISFNLETDGKGKMNLWVVDIEAGAKATQNHKVTLKLKPIGEPLNKEETDTPTKKSTGGGGGGGFGNKLPNFAPSKI
ncbi:hypothetical protein CGJ53_23950 [Vibrio parahaemolyticus]|nr:hypothetical protein CGJ53_23950 [Vibrio parahaemolyticus]